MIKKDYIVIAKAINEWQRIWDANGLDDLICRLSASFTDDNPRFNWGRFRDACLKEQVNAPRK